MISDSLRPDCNAADSGRTKSLELGNEYN